MDAADVIRYAVSYARKIASGDPDEFVGQALLAYWKVQVQIKAGHITVEKPDAYLFKTVQGTCKNTLVQMAKHKHIDFNLVPLNKISYSFDYSSELIEALKLNQYEKQIVDMRLEGLNDREIGEILSKAACTIAKARSKIAERLEVIIERT